MIERVDTTNERFQPIMPFPYCPTCGAVQHLDKDTYDGYKGPVTCGSCKFPYEVTISTAHSYMGPRQPARLTSPPRSVVPAELLEEIPRVPGEIWGILVSAARCLAFNEPLAAAVLCRRVVQHALLAVGLEDGPPTRMVERARSRDLLTELAYRNCMAAVFMGGKAAHPQADPLDEVINDDARQALLATRAVLRELFRFGELALRYSVYENRIHNYAAVHRATCGYLKMHGGVSSTKPPTGEYHEGFETAEAALNKATGTGRDVRICQGCNPPVSN